MKEVTNSKTPSLRFPDFVQDWEDKSFVNFIVDYKGGAPLEPKDFVKESNYEVIPKKSITSGGVLMMDKENPTYCSETFYRKFLKSVIDNSYLVTTLRDLVPSGPSIGYIVKFKEEKSYLLAQGVYGIKINKEKLDELFLIQISNRITYRRLMQKIMVGSTQVHIRNNDFFKIKLGIPSIEEQQKISSFLTSVDKSIDQLTRKKELLELYKKGVVQKIFNQEIRFKDDDGNDFPKWEEKKLGEVSKIIGGGTPDTTNEDYWNGDIQWFTPTEIKSKYIYESKRKISKKGLEQSSSKILPIGTILFTSRATIGDIGIAMVECTTNQGFQSFITNKSTSNEFLYYWITFNRNRFLRLSSGSTFLEISKTEILKIKILMPSLKEQTKISTFLSSIDLKINLVDKEIGNMKIWKKGLLQQLFV